MFKNKTFAQKKLILLAVLSGALVLLISAYFIVNAVIKNLDTGNSNSNDPEFDLIEGESYYLGIPLVYSPFESSQIKALVVKQGEQEFTIARMSLYGNSFVFSFDDGSGSQVYLPTISNEDSYFDYSSLYATDSMVSGSSEMPKITYVCSAVGMLYYDERIPLSADEAEKKAQLTEYGFDADSPTITFTYTERDADGNETTKAHSIRIGGKVITDAAYYFTVDSRPYVYATTTPYFDYALMSLEDFIESNLVAAGVGNDSAFAPRLTPDYQQWKNTTYYYEVDENGKYTYYSSNGETKVDPWLIPEGSQIYCKVSALNPIDYTAGYWQSNYADEHGVLLPELLGGYKKSGDGEEIFDLSVFTHENGYGYALENIKDLPIGTYAEPIVFTGIGDYTAVTFGSGEDKKSSVTYAYKITAIESLFGADGEVFTAGAAVGNADRIKVTYTYTVDGEHPKYNNDCHTVIDLSKTDLIPAAAIEKLRAASLGELAEAIEFDITYTEENAIKRTTRLIIKDVFRVYSNDGRNLLQTVESDSIVSFRYYYEVNGKATGEPEAYTLDLSTVNSESSELHRLFKQALVGKKLELEQNIEVSSSTEYCQPMSYFVTYEMSNVEFYVTSELTVAFKFINSSDRDPFYRESIYENTMGDDHKYGLYAVNSYSCDAVVNLLGGANSDSSGSEGYQGYETVSVDLSPENMKKYGLFAHRIYFKLPRGIYSPEYAAGYESVEYAWYETLGFTLYISDEMADEEGKLYRYAASTMYNIIVKVDAEDFRFLEYSFIDLWARRNMFMVGISDIDGIEAALNMSDLNGAYDIKFGHTYKYVSKATGQVWYDKSEIPSGTSYNEYDEISLHIKPTTEDISDSKLKDYYEGNDGLVNFNDFYYAVTGVEKKNGDLTGTSNMKEFVRILLNTSYTGTLTEQEQAEAKESAPLMSLAFKLNGVAYRYGYDFYRIDDRRVMVSIYRLDTYGDKLKESSYFYISTSSFKKIAGAFSGMLDGKMLDGNIAYQD